LFPNESLLGIISRDRAEPFKVNATMFSSDPFKEGLPKKIKISTRESQKSLQRQATKNNDSLHRTVILFPLKVPQQ
jgi:hypothetical protein